MRAAVRRALLLLAVAVSGSAKAAAQDAHYWTYGYGPVGQLTEGTLVGGVSDLSATYYNPGALALLDKPRFVVGLTSVEFANIDAPDVGGDGLDADQLVFDIVPSMIAGQVGGDDGPSRFAFAFLSRHDSDWDLGLSATDVSATRPDARAGFGRVRHRLVEYWVGATWSRRLSDRLSVGVSSFFAYRAQRSRRSIEVEDVAGGASRAAFFGLEHEGSWREGFGPLWHRLWKTYSAERVDDELGRVIAPFFAWRSLVVACPRWYPDARVESRDRLLSFLNPEADPLGKGFQAMQSMIAIGTGGLTGLGIGNGRQKLFFLPEPHTDFIFSIVGEELGFIGTTTVLLLFFVLAWRGYRAALAAPDLFGSMLAVGLTSVICFQAILNIGVATGSLPVTGVTLPFLSFGGTSLVATFAAVGVLLNISRTGESVKGG